MTIEDAPARGALPVAVTRLPERGSVLAVAAEPPAVPGRHTVDVRPGPYAAFDGDRAWLPLVVRSGGERHRLDHRDRAGVEAAVAALLRRDGSGDPPVVRFGDVAAARRALPGNAADALERRLAAAAGRAGTPLLAWTSRLPPPGDCRTYDVVLPGTRRRRG